VTADITGKTALITGAGRGIGRAIALELAGAGADLILVARSDSQLAQTRALLLSRGKAAESVRVVRADLGDEDERRHVVEGTRADILINNAATVEPLGATAGIPAGDLRRAFEVNVVAPEALTAAVLPGMLDAGWGRVVNVSSAVVARPGAMVRGNAYVVTKAALEAHTVNLAAELSGTGVTVNAYRPGGVDTAMQAWIREQDPERVGTALHERFTRSYAEGALITPAQSAKALIARLGGDETGAIWDVSDDLAVLQVLRRDGGQQAVEVLVARAARGQVRGHARVATGRVLVRRDQVRVDVQHRQRLLAPDISRVGGEETPQRVLAVHSGPSFLSSR
jgi:NAD(P)-dependent dehydrogenase (short-subunit alcohol dehydrogenase family)